MQKPGPHEFILGNRAVTLTLLGASGLAFYMSATEGVSWLCPILLVLIGHRAGKARAKVVEFQKWRGAWNNVAGTADRPALKARVPRALGWRVGLAVWAITLAWLYENARASDTANYRIVAASAALLSLLGLKRILPRVWRSTRSESLPAQRQGADGPIVTTPLPVPRNSPRAADIDLPDYARALILMPHQKEQQP